ncbi:MAG: hypothetical protein ACFCGT_10400 [Sandaracinaceae bacterium]
MRTTSFASTALLVGALLAGQAAVAAPAAHAQDDCTMAPTDPMAPNPCVRRVSADAKGIIGGGILGAEVMFLTNALLVRAGARALDEWWAWVLFPTLGATGGALLGYFILEEPGRGVTMPGMPPQSRGYPEAAVATLTVSLALIIPTMVAVLALTAYNPGDDAQRSPPPPDDDGGGAGGEDPPPEASLGARLLAGGPGLVRVDRGRVRLGLPMLGGIARYTDEERAALNLPPASDLHLPLVSGAF